MKNEDLFKLEYEEQLISMPPLKQEEDESFIKSLAPEKVSKRLKQKNTDPSVLAKKK